MGEKSTPVQHIASALKTKGNNDNKLITVKIQVRTYTPQEAQNHEIISITKKTRGNTHTTGAKAKEKKNLLLCLSFMHQGPSLTTHYFEISHPNLHAQYSDLQQYIIKKQEYRFENQLTNLFSKLLIFFSMFFTTSSHGTWRALCISIRKGRPDPNIRT